MPFHGKILVDRFYDHAPGDAFTWWNELDHTCPPSNTYCTQKPIGTDKHSGTDFILPERSSLLAAAPGKVIGISGLDLCSSIVVYHGYFRGHHILSGYTHLSQIIVKLGERVRRGSTLGFVGDTRTPGYTHLHFDVFSLDQLQNPQDMDMLDPYQGVVPVSDGTWWRTFNSLASPMWIVDHSPSNLSGWWTVTNQPQYP